MSVASVFWNCVSNNNKDIARICKVINCRIQTKINKPLVEMSV